MAELSNDDGTPNSTGRHRPSSGSPLRRRVLAGAVAAAVAALLVLTGVVVTRLSAQASPPPRTVAASADPGLPQPSSSGAVPTITPPVATPSAATSPVPTRTSGAPKAKRIPAAATGSKKGVSTWEFPGLSGAVSHVGASWYYNWSPSNDSMRADAEFVPMIWGSAAVTDANLATVKREGKVLLGFNEPDLEEQSNLTVEKALDLWPRLESTGMRLGSPAVAYGGDTAGGWLDRFMTGAKQRNLRVDFITLHWYGSDFSAAAAGQFAGYLKAVHARYGLPIWVTEYGLINFTGSPKYPSARQIAAFITASTTAMQKASYVERYAWFSLPAVGDSVEYGLYRDGDSPTAAGEAYRAAG
jgi:hypothetical protein